MPRTKALLLPAPPNASSCACMSSTELAWRKMPPPLPPPPPPKPLAGTLPPLAKMAAPKRGAPRWPMVKEPTAPTSIAPPPPPPPALEPPPPLPPTSCCARFPYGAPPVPP